MEKMFQRLDQKSIYETVVPFDSEKEDLFDDCPLCQKLKKQLESGEVEEVSLEEREEGD